MKNAMEVFFSSMLKPRHGAAIHSFGQKKASGLEFVMMDTVDESLQSLVAEECFPVG